MGAQVSDCVVWCERRMVSALLAAKTGSHYSIIGECRCGERCNTWCIVTKLQTLATGNHRFETFYVFIKVLKNMFYNVFIYF